MAYHNPWARELVERERRYFADGEYGMGGAYSEAADADRKPPLACGVCGAQAWYKPTVGAYVCPECGAVRVAGFVNKETGERRGVLSGEEQDAWDGFAEWEPRRPR